MTKTRSPKSVPASVGTAPNPKPAAARIVWLGLGLLIAALCIRLLWQNRVHSNPPPSPPLALDDSQAEIPLAPPPLPTDNAQALKAAHAQLDRLAADSTLPGLQKLAAAALEMGDLWQAEAAARSALALEPKDRLARLTLAASLRQREQFDGAAQVYHQLIAEDPRDSDAYLGLADTMFAANRRPEAFKWLERGAKEGAQTALALSTLAHRYQDWKDYPEAEKTAARAIQIAPDNLDARLQLASIQVESAKLDDAYSALDALLAQDPKNGLAHRLMAVVLMNPTFKHRDLDRARKLLERAVELNPRDPDIYRSAAAIYHEQRLFRLEAQADDALLHLEPSNSEARYGLGQLYARLGKAELSAQQLTLYRQLDERHRRATRLTEEAAHYPLNAQNHAALARFFESAGDFAGALPQYQTAAGLAPNDSALKQDLDRFYTRLQWDKPKPKSK